MKTNWQYHLDHFYSFERASMNSIINQVRLGKWKWPRSIEPISLVQSKWTRGLYKTEIYTVQPNMLFYSFADVAAATHTERAITIRGTGYALWTMDICSVIKFNRVFDTVIYSVEHTVCNCADISRLISEAKIITFKVWATISVDS